MSDLVTSLATAIAQFEGFFKPGTVAQRNNNPGNLRSGAGQIGTDAGGYAIFPDPTTGWAALDHQVTVNINRGLTLQQFIGGKPGVYPGYAPSADNNNVTSYVSFLSGKLGLSPDTVLSGVSPGDFRMVPRPSPPQGPTHPGTTHS